MFQILKGPFCLSAALSSDVHNIRYINADLGEGKPYKVIATVRHLNEVSQEESLAVAKLLSLAPELRDVLQAFVEDIDGRFGDVPDDCDAYHAATKLLAQLPSIVDLSECSLGELQGEPYTLVQLDTDVRQIADDYAGGNKNITGAVVKAKDGEYEAIWVTESATPFSLLAVYTQIKWN